MVPNAIEGNGEQASDFFAHAARSGVLARIEQSAVPLRGSAMAIAPPVLFSIPAMLIAEREREPLSQLER